MKKILGIVFIIVVEFTCNIEAGLIDRRLYNRTLAAGKSKPINSQDLGPPDHLDAVKLERDGDTNSDFHQEIFLGEEKHHFKEAQTRDEQLKKLKIIFQKADVDKNNKISEEELHMWIMKMVEEHMQQATKDSLEKFYFVAGNGAESVSYPVFEKAFYESLRKDNETHKHQYTEEYFKTRISAVKQKWKVADLNNDGILSEREFLFFQHPEMSSSTLDSSVTEFLEERDYDGNKKLDEKEFVFGFPVGDIILDDYMDGDELIRDKLMQFRKYIDADHDGFLSVEELTIYMDPFSSVNARNDAHDMMFYIDTDTDGELSWDEIMEASEYLTGTKLYDASSYFHSEL